MQANTHRSEATSSTDLTSLFLVDTKNKNNQGKLLLIQYNVKH